MTMKVEEKTKQLRQFKIYRKKMISLSNHCGNAAADAFGSKNQNPHLLDTNEEEKIVMHNAAAVCRNVWPTLE